MPKDSGSAFPHPSQRVVVLRHGERRDSAPSAPVESDPPLTEAGVAAIKSVANRLKHLLGEDAAHCAVLVVSPFLRTLQTAESLQHHGVGASDAAVVDNTLCEVFGPSRIKTSRAPQLHTPSASSVVGGLPVWGESIEAATERYVANFLRNGDVYGGVLSAPTSLTNSSHSGQDESPTSQSLVVPEAVTKRKTGCLQMCNASPIALGSWKARNSRSLSDAPPRDVILVTHGDAISAVVSHFYPTRVVYEADFLSFIIMRRYGAGNHVYHLEASAGVSWLVEGIDKEPQDPILRSLERRLLDEECGSSSGCHGESKDRDGSFDVDDDDADGEADVPSSFAGARMRTCRTDGFRDNSRAHRTPRSFPHSRVEKLSRVHAANCHDPTNSSQGTGATAQNDDFRGSLSLSTAGVRTPPPLPACRERQLRNQPSYRLPNLPANHSPTANASGAASTPALQLPCEYPKGGEGCERIRLPTGTPAQSSSHSVTTNSNGRGVGRCEENAKADGVGSGISHHRSYKTQVKGASSAVENWQTGERNKAGKRFMPGEPSHDSSLDLLSGYGDLSEELSANCCVRSSVTLVALPASTVVRINDGGESSRLGTTTAVVTPRNLDSCGSAAADCATKGFEGYCADDDLCVGGGASWTACTRPDFANAAATDASSDSTDSLDRRIDRQQRVIYAAFVSLCFRIAASLFLLCYVLVQRHNIAALRFGIWGLTWEMGFAVVLHFSCQSGSWRMRRVRGVAEQLHLDVLCASAKATTAERQCLSIDGADAYDDARGALSTGQRLRPFDRPCVRMREYVRAATWQQNSGHVEEDALMTSSVPQGTMARVMFGVRLVAAILVKLLIISTLSLASAFFCGSCTPQVVADVYRIYEPTVGFALLLTYVCVCLARGLWDEAKLDSALDSV